MGYLLLPILLVLMYLVLLRPQQQRLRSQRQLVATLDVGDEVITAGGMIGRIVALSDDQASIEVADGIVIDFLRAAISRKAEGLGPPPALADEEDADHDDEDPADPGPPAVERDAGGSGFIPDERGVASGDTPTGTGTGTPRGTGTPTGTGTGTGSGTGPGTGGATGTGSLADHPDETSR